MLKVWGQTRIRATVALDSIQLPGEYSLMEISLSGDDDIFAEVRVHLLIHFKPVLLDLRAVGPENAVLVSSPLIGKIGDKV
jgi:hypothetical protein